MSATLFPAVAPVAVAPAPERRVRPAAPMAVSSRTRWGFSSPRRSLPRSAGGLQVELLEVVGAGFAFAPARSVVPAGEALVVVETGDPVLDAPLAPAVVDEPVAPAPVRVPAGAASVRVVPLALAFRVAVVDLDSDELGSVLVSAPSARAARLECSDESFAPVAVWAVLPGGGEELVWGEAV